MEISFGLNGDFMGSFMGLSWEKARKAQGNLTIGLETTSLNRKQWCFFCISRWWVDGYPPEAYEFVSWDYSSQYMGKTCSKPPTRYVFFLRFP